MQRPFTETSKFFKCNCFLTSNIFVKRLGKHFTYKNDKQFLQENEKILDKLGSDEEKLSILEEIKTEVQRREKIDDESVRRKSIIKSSYTKRHPDIYKLQESFLDPQFIKLVHACSHSQKECDILNYVDILSKEKQIYSFPVFNEEFCQRLLEELDHFERSKLPKGKPNSMNHYGILLHELGFREFFLDPLRSNYINFIAKHFYPEFTGKGLDSHRAFTVHYKIGEDVELNEHFDNAEVTLNVCLGKSFKGGDIYFGDMKFHPVEPLQYCTFPHKIGYGIFHRSQQLHGTLPITEGERINMIIWFRSSSVRNKCCPMCNETPKLVIAKDYGDGFTVPSPSCKPNSYCVL